MSTFALVVLGVGACIGVATSLLLRPDEPATSSAPPVRAPARRRTVAPAPIDGPLEGEGEGGVDVDLRDEAVPVAPRPRRPPRPVRPPEGEPNLPTPWHVRLLAVVQLAGIAVLLGIAAAAAVGLAILGLFGLLRGAVG